MAKITITQALQKTIEATKKYVDNSVAGLVDSAPETLNTLNELSAALGNDENFATTVSTQIGLKVDKTELNNYALKTEIPSAYTHPESHPASMITGLATVATSGSYNDLTNKPTIPTVSNDLTDVLKANYDAAYTHSQAAHAPSNAQANADITKEEIEAKLTGDISTHTHSQYLTEHQDLSDYALQSDLHEHSNKDLLDTITQDMTTKWNQALPFNDTYVSDCNAWLTNGYIKTDTSTSNHPSVCTGSDRWGVLFFVAENASQGTGTQMYFPIDGTYVGRVFVRSMTRGTGGDWTLLSTFDGDYNSLTNKPESQDLSAYAKTADLAAVATSGSYNDLSNKPTIPTATSQLTNDSNYITSIPSEYITETELNAKGYLTAHQDLSAYAKTSSIPTKTSQLTNDSGYITSVPSEYVTESELTAKGYATTSQIPTIPTTLPANGGNADTVDNIHIVKITQSGYEALSTKDANTLYLIVG